MKKQTILLFILFFLGGTIWCQNIVIKGIVITDNGNPIPDVVISRNWSKSGIVSKYDGCFQLEVTTADTLVFKHLSFEPKAIAIANIPTTDSLMVSLKVRTIELGEVQITNWGTWEDFKTNILKRSIDSINNTPLNRLRAIFPNASHPIKNPYFRALQKIKITPLNIIGGIFSGNLPAMLYTNLSKEQKYRREISQDILREQRIAKNSGRYSERIIKNILNIEGEELKQFKIYCDSQINLSLNDYELTEQINTLYKRWKKFKDKELIFNIEK